MAYQVLARKYRPQRFADVIGQDHVTVTLMNALAQNRIAHGYIFSGHRGIGKTSPLSAPFDSQTRGLLTLASKTDSLGNRVHPKPCAE